MSDALPPGWALTNIGTLGRYINGRGFGKAEWKKSGLPIIRIQNLTDEAASFNYSDQEHEAKYRVKNGDLLVSWAATLGVYMWQRGPGWLNQHIFRVEPEERAVTKPFLFYSLKHALDALYKKTHGSGMVHVTKDRFDSHPINLPPLNEQKRIVSKIDELFSEIEDGERALERVQKLVERYRQSVLKAAVTGELTRDWREKHKGKLESGEALLARILKARREAWEKAELDKMKAKGIKPDNDKWKQKYEEPKPPETSGLPELPYGWTWVSVDQIAADTLIGLDRGAAEQRTDPKGGCPYIKMNNITMDGRVVFDDLVYVTASDEERDRFSTSDRDILFNTRNSKELVGKTGLVVGAPAGALYNNNIMRMRAVSLADPRFIATHMCEPSFRSRLELVKKATTSVAAVYAKDLFPLALALPPPEEQEQIMSEVDRAVEAAHQMQQELAGRLRAAAALRQSVLREAFRGELAPQNAADEPASKLLERIAAARGPDTAAPKRGRRKAAA